MTLYSAFGYGKDYYTNKPKPYIERISLHPVLDNEEMGKGPKFKVRVAWRYVDDDTWHISCRCSDMPELKAFTDHIEGGVEFNSFDEAISWLKTGKLPEKLVEKVQREKDLQKKINSLSAIQKKYERAKNFMLSRIRELESKKDTLEDELMTLEDRIDDIEMEVSDIEDEVACL